MTFLQWRRFNFFDKEILKEESNPLNELLNVQKSRITCSSSGGTHIIVGDSNGLIHIIDRQLQFQSFIAYKEIVTHCHQLISSSYLVTVGADEVGINPVVKVWNRDKMNLDKVPHCSRVIRLSTGLNPSPVTAIDVLDSLNLMAIGFADGNVILFRGDITREKNCKQKLISISNSAVTGLAFKNNSLQTNKTLHKQNILFISTTKEIISFNVITRDKEMKTTLDSFGCDIRCSCLKNDPKQLETLFIVGRKDAIYFYQSDERGPCLAFEGEKLLLYWYRSYLIVIGKETASSAATSAATSNEKLQPNGTEYMNIITIYDISRKFIAYSSPIPSVSEIWGEWGALYLVTNDGRLIHLRERDTQTKLEMLFKKNQFSLAIELAKAQNFDSDALSDIFKQYGDHLYRKGDLDAAIAQYIHTIGRLEASYVIRKFLDVQRIQNLTSYLQALHRKGLANEDHTTLLINCYVKLKDNSNLDQFLKSDESTNICQFDVDIAIKVLRQAGYYDHALYLAKKHRRYDWFFRINLEDKCDAKEAIDYMKQMDSTELTEYMKKYGRLLVSEAPDGTTELLKSLCTYPSEGSELLSDNTNTTYQTSRPKPEEFIHIFVKNTSKLIEFLEFMIESHGSDCSAEVHNTLLELYLQSYKNEIKEDGLAIKETQILNLLKSSDTTSLEQAMVLCQISRFDAGLLYLYEKANMFKSILNYFIASNDENKVLQTCEKFGHKDPTLWVDALWFYSKADDNKKTIQVLNEIEKKRLLPPITIIEILARSETATLAVIKDYLIRWLTRENELIAENERLINEFKDETEKIRQQMEDMKTSPKVFQSTKCCGCNQNLELPSIHFLCSHSYHQHCFESYAAENDSDCPLCLPENRKILNQINSLENINNVNVMFDKQIEETDDCFTLIADYFSQGIFNKVTLVTDGTVIHRGASAARPHTLNLSNK